MQQQTENLPVAVRATRALAGIATEAALSALADRAREITVVTNHDGYKQCHSTRMDLRNTRVFIEKAGKSARDDANAFAKAVIAEEKRLIGFIGPEEDRLEGLQRAWEEAREAEKRAREDAERQRVAALRAEVDRIKNRPVTAAAWPSVKLRDELAGLEGFEPSEGAFQEFVQEALAAREAAIRAILNLIEAAEAREEEQRRLAEERAELDRLRAEQEAREAWEREAAAQRAEEERKAREAEEAKRRAQLEAEQAELRRQQEEILRREREADAKRVEEERAHQARLAAERLEHEAKLRAEREEQERQAEEARRQRQADEDRIAAEKAEAERRRRDAEEAERKAKEEAERLAREREEGLRLAEEERKSRIERAAPMMLAALEAVLADCADADNAYSLSPEAGRMVRAAIAEATVPEP